MRGGRPLLATAGCLLLALSCVSLPEEPPTPTPVPTRDPLAGPTAVVERGTLVETLRTTGLVTGSEEVFLHFPVDGRLAELAVEVGDLVSAGEPVARLDTGTLEFDLELARLDVEAARLRLDQAPSPAELALREIELRKARLEVERLEHVLAQSRLEAPFDGVVSFAEGRPGEMWPAFQPVVAIADTRSPEVRVELQAAQAARVGTGQPATIQSPALPEPIAAEVVAVATGGPGASRVARLRFLDGQSHGLELGQSVQVVIEVQRVADALHLPAAAVRKAFNRTYVIVIRDGQLVEVDVEMGIQADGRLEVRGDLHQGEAVLLP